MQNVTKPKTTLFERCLPIVGFMEYIPQQAAGDLEIENDAINQSWRYGTLRLDVQPDGRR